MPDSEVDDPVNPIPDSLRKWMYSDELEPEQDFQLFVANGQCDEVVLYVSRPLVSRLIVVIIIPTTRDVGPTNATQHACFFEGRIQCHHGEPPARTFIDPGASRHERWNRKAGVRREDASVKYELAIADQRAPRRVQDGHVTIVKRICPVWQRKCRRVQWQEPVELVESSVHPAGVPANLSGHAESVHDAVQLAIELTIGIRERDSCSYIATILGV